MRELAYLLGRRTVVAAHGHRVPAVPRTEVAENEGGMDQAEEHRTVLVEGHTVLAEHRMAAADIALEGEVRRRAVAEDRGYGKEHRTVAVEEDSHGVVDCAGSMVDNLAVGHSQDRARHHSLGGAGDLEEEGTDPKEAVDNPLRD